jgi:hypothetical protein
VAQVAAHGAQALDLRVDLVGLWASAWLTAWLFAFPAVMLVAPLAQRAVRSLVAAR